ncbi:serine hydrolase domain-containing protein [Pontibacter lucknowensis]|uniref:CubicO group peptidase, beta-lactamase class C family n=1 Tax=Pontibacter lucknowensis TaxID=1077936 RepID=A0A1N7A1M8_9BACT|nr:serine hydrolase domain-containing protein [Pontibacter lucknowensis]SIR32913.1 CubicO group peptidase, beta-lactamase class C family [Pontibacter lucknowensis]
MKNLTQEALDKILASTAAKKHIHGAAFRVEAADGSFSLMSAAGNMQPDTPFYIASVNKIILAAVTLRLVRDGRLGLDDKIRAYLPAGLMQGLHVYKGLDYAEELTIRHLISQTSGLPCYLIDKCPGQPKLMKELLSSQDAAWPLEKTIEQVKQMRTKFAPGQPGKASYGNTNFKLLGRILESVMAQPLDQILAAVFEELGMAATYVISLQESRTFSPFYHKSHQVSLPLYLSSSRYDIVSTTQDLMTFVKAFFNGHFYPKNRLQELEQWNSIFFPFKYGIGIQKFYTPRLLSPFKAIPDLIGHCGSTGTAAFYIPAKSAFVTGAINQASSPSMLFQTLIKIANKL